MWQEPRSPGSRKFSKRKKPTLARSRERKQISPRPRAKWPLERYDAEFWNWLERINPNEVRMLSDAGRRALAVLLKSERAHRWMASACDARRLPRNIHPMLKGLRTRTLAALAKAEKYPHLNGSLLEQRLKDFSDFLAGAVVPRPNPPLGHRAATAKEYRDRIAWPFFPPALFYAIERLYERGSEQSLRREDFFELLSKLLPHHAPSADAASRWVYRFKRDSARVSAIESLVSTLLSTPVDK